MGNNAKKICSFCKSEILESDLFCPNCGMEVGNNKDTEKAILKIVQMM